MGERIAPAHISWLAIPAYQYFLAAVLTESAADLARPPPDQLGVMRHILRTPGAAISRKDAGNEILLLGYPQVHHRFGAKRSRRTTPNVLALKRSAGSVGGVLEPPGAGQIVGPRLCALGQIIVPAKRRNAGQSAFAIVAGEQPII